MTGRSETFSVKLEGTSSVWSASLSITLPLLSGTLAFVVYALTIAPDLTWSHYGGDGGELITAAMTWGVPHPPGYPTYVVLGRALSLLPLGTVAWRFNLFSALSAAIAAAAICATARTMLRGNRYRDVAALAASMAVALSTLVWSQAVIAEVYALNLAFVSLFLWATLARRAAFLSGLFLGLAITAHLSSLLLAPLALALCARQRWRALATGLAVGLLPFLLLPFFARLGSPVAWGDPSTFGNWWQLVSGQLYHANLRLPAGEAFLPRSAALMAGILAQLAWLGWLFVLLGVAARLLPRRVTLALLLTASLYAVYTFLYQSDDAAVNLLPLLALLGPLLAAGLTRAGVWSLLLPAGLLALNLQSVSLHGQSGVRPQAEMVLAQAPHDAVLLTGGDRSIFALWYFHHVEGQRQDLVLVDENLFAFDWYRQRLQAQHGAISALEHDDLATFRRENGRWRPLCEVPANLEGRLECTALARRE